MSTGTKKGKGGRPPRSASERLQRVSLSLKPSHLLALEVVARDRRTSLSQAAEYLIEQQFDGYKVGEDSAADAVKIAANGVMLFAESAPEDSPIRKMSREDVIAKMLSSAAGRSLFMPPSLLLPSERYFAEFFGEIMRGAFSQTYPQLVKLFHMALVDSEKLDGLLEAAEMLERNGVGIRDAAKRYVDLLIEINTRKDRG